MLVYVVIASGYVLGVYIHEDMAHMHMRTVTGAVVIPAQLREYLPQSVIDEISSDFEDNDPTPVTQPFKKE